MSHTLTLQVLWSLFENRREGVLATVRRNGRPQLSNIGYVYDPGNRVASTAARARRLGLRPQDIHPAS